MGAQQITISMIAAIGRERELGANGDLLWHIPEDFAHFKHVTMGAPVIMGRSTFQSLPDSARPLPGRTNIVMTRSGSDAQLIAQNVEVAHSVDEALDIAREIARHKHQSEVFVIGGGNIYAQFLPVAHRLYLTVIDAQFPQADVFFPEYEQEFHHVISQRESYNDQYRYTFLVLEKSL